MKVSRRNSNLEKSKEQLTKIKTIFLASPDRPCLKHGSWKTPYSKVYWEGMEFIYNFHFNIQHSNCFWYQILMNVESGLNVDHLNSGMVLS